MLDQGNETPSDSVEPVSSNPRIDLSLEEIDKEIDKVRDLIERCLQFYMTRDKAMHALSTQANIQPVFTYLVWKRLEEQNPNFFRAYHTWLQVKEQIKQFNDLLEKQCQLMQHTAISSQNGTYDLLHNQMSMSTLQRPSVPSPSRHMMNDVFDSYLNPLQPQSVHVPPNFHLMSVLMESRDMYTFQTPLSDASELCHDPISMESSCQEIEVRKLNESRAVEFERSSSYASSQNQIPVAPNYGHGLKSVASNAQFHSHPTAYVESTIGIGTSMLNPSFPRLPIGSRLGPDFGEGCSRESVLPLTSIPWNVSFPELPAEDLKLSEVDELFADPSGSGSSSSLHFSEGRP